MVLEFAAHETVRHSTGEYVRGDVHSNTIESYFSIFKRGMRGTYQHCAEKHLHRYLAEFDFRHNKRKALGLNDVSRADSILTSIVGKRLTYETTLARWWGGRYEQCSNYPPVLQQHGQKLILNPGQRFSASLGSRFF